MLTVLMVSCNGSKKERGTEEYDMYDGPELAARQDFEMTKDPATGKVPYQKILTAIEKTSQSKKEGQSSLIEGLSWIERGPNTDLSGPNGNPRPIGVSTSGRVRAMMVDSLDATKKTVWAGGVDGGLWRTADITASPATWVLINDNLSNLAIADICQDPRPGFQNIMYFCTGESYFNADAVRGVGVFKSTDAGATWTFLASTSNFINGTRILCDYLGNVYVGGRTFGLRRSTDGGTTWTNITPTTFPNSDVCDLEISSTAVTGRLHVVCGIFSTQAYRYVDNPAVATSASWTTPADAFPSFNNRAEICVSGSTLYSLVADGSNQVPTIYKSTNGGANWAATADQPAAGWASGQAWYDLSCAIDPSSSGSTCIVGGLDLWKTTNGGSGWTKISSWVATTTGFYVHADQHDIQWWDNGNKLMFGCDGGVYYSGNGGTSITDKNSGLRIKQFYSCAIHPLTTNYFLGGTQDNGVHQLNNAGMGASVEVTGGDGGFVHIDQNQPQYQWGSYVYNQYRRSTNNGSSWSVINYTNNEGRFINPTDYDDVNNIMYCSGVKNTFLRWDNPQTGNTFTSVVMTELDDGTVSAVKVSPYTNHTVFFAGGRGTVVPTLIKATNANATPVFTNIISTGMQITSANISCVELGTDEQNIIVVFSNYGINNVWVTNNGGTSWTPIDGNLPNMPVRWAMFYPGDNTKAIIATETGVWQTELINGGNTSWEANPTFPTVRTDMIKYRASDRTIAAATHGRGLWTTTIPIVTSPDLSFQTSTASANELTTFTSGCRGYTDYTYYMVIANPPTGAGTVTLRVDGGTATNSVDYAVTTNGNFAAPSMTLNFPSGSGVAQPFTIRIYDDASVESVETFTLNYMVTGTNVQPGTEHQTLTYTIIDNDAAPVTGGVEINGVGNYNASGADPTPFRSNQAKFRIQNLWTASELIAAGFTSARDFNSMTIYVLVKNSSVPYTNFTISMANTSQTTLSSGFQAGTFTTVYPANNYSSVAGPNLLTFTNPFAWDGFSNILIDFCFDNIAAEGLSDITEGTITAIGPGIKATTYSNNLASTPCTGDATFFTNARIWATFSTSVPSTPVSTAVSSKIAYIGPYDDVPFYDASGKIIARIRNNTGWDYGCTTVQIDRSGTGATAFWNNTIANYLTDKTFKVYPTNANDGGSYDITLYYSALEKAGYEMATGNTWLGVSIVKVGSQISSVTPGNPTGGGIVTVNSLVTQASHGQDYTVKATFSNGFSGFAVGKPSIFLPISLLDFKGRKNGSAVDFTWRTAYENNNSHFEIETSKNDVSYYYKIGSVNSKGNSTGVQSYTYTDNLPMKGVNYYRLKQVDRDNTSTYSQTVAVTFNDDGAFMTLYPNPATDKLTIMFANAHKNVQAKIFSSDGKLVKTEKLGNVIRNIDLNINYLFPGNYLLQIITSNDKKLIKFIKQ